MKEKPVDFRGKICPWVFTSSHTCHRPFPSSTFFNVLIHVMLQSLHSHISDNTPSTIHTPQIQVRNIYAFLCKRGTENKFTQTRHKFSILLTKKKCTKYYSIYLHLKNSNTFYYQSIMIRELFVCLSYKSIKRHRDYI